MLLFGLGIYQTVTLMDLPETLRLLSSIGFTYAGKLKPVLEFVHHQFIRLLNVLLPCKS
jgi:hypothetical protein